MALPTLLVPGDQLFRREGYEFQPVAVYGDAPMQTGAARRRRTSLSAPTVASVSLDRDQAGVAAFNDWYEGPLKAGTEFFSALIATPGQGILWWKARFLERYKADLDEGGWWKITAKLMLFGAGSSTGPDTSILSGGVIFELLGDGTLTVGQPLTGGVTFALLSGTANFVVGAVTLALLTGTYVPPVVGVGAAAGTSTASGAGRVIAVGNAAGTSTAQASAPGMAVGSAAGTSEAVGRVVSTSLNYPSRGATWVSSSALVAATINDVPVYIKRAGLITGVSVLTLGGPGSCVLDIWKLPFASYPPALANSICSSALPTISAGITYLDTTLLGWTTAVAAGDTLLFHIQATSIFTLIAISLHFSENA